MNTSNNQKADSDLEIKNYTIIELIGEGGYGKVYKALQKSTEQTVAIKLLKFSLTLDENKKKQQIHRFERETKLCAEISHPNIVKMLDKGYTTTGEPFAVFEYISGVTLKDLIIKNNGLAPQKAALLMGQVLDALVSAHKKGIVHRDLKPQNIMVTNTGAAPVAKVLDFGIGAITHEVRSKDYMSLTLTKEMVGTPAYSAPEQLRGEAPTVKSDLYAWGLVLIECLTGQPVIHGNSVAEIFQQQLHPSNIVLPASLAGHEIADILRKVLDKKSRTRIGDATRLYNDFIKINFQSLVGNLSEKKVTHAIDSDTEVNEMVWTPTANEKRQINVLAIKLGMTVTKQCALDTETIETIHQDQLRNCEDIAIRYGGYTAGKITNNLLIYFGYPQVSDNDARRAGRTALEIISQIKRRGETLLQQQGLEFHIRIAIHSGDVMINPNATPDGKVPGTAFDLLYQTRDNSVQVTETSKKLLDPYLVFKKPTHIQLAFSHEAIPIYELVGEHQMEASSFLRPWSANRAMIGRIKEKNTILSAWKDTITGNGSSILIKGRAGIGKSKLIYEIKKEIHQQQYAIKECRCLPEHQNNALYPFFYMLRNHWEIDTIQTVVETIAILEKELEKIGCELTESMPILCSWLSIPLPDSYTITPSPPEQQKNILFSILKNYILSLGNDLPFLLIIEDLHWTDPTSKEFIEFLLSDLSDHSLLMIMTARLEFTHEWKQTYHRDISLKTLSKTYTRNLILGVLEGGELDQETLNYIAQRTDGIPLYIEELTKMLHDQGYLTQEDNLYQLIKKEAIKNIPVTLKDLLNARLDTLGFAKETAQLAAAIGREFSYDILIKSSLRDEGLVQNDLDILVSADLIYRQRKVEGESYIFRHALIRDAAYDGMVSSYKKEVHLRIADALKNEFETQTFIDAFLIATHLAEAEKYEEACEYGIKAAKNSLEHSSNLEIKSITNSLLNWVPQINDEIVKNAIEFKVNFLRYPSITAIHGIGHEELTNLSTRNNEIDNFLTSKNYFEHKKDQFNTRFLNSFTLLQNELYTGNYDAAIEIGEEILAESEVLKNRHYKILVLPSLAQTYHIKGNLTKAEQLLNTGLKLYNDNEDKELWKTFGIEAKANSLYILGFLKCCLGEIDNAYKLCNEGYEWSEKIGCSMFSDFGKVFSCWIAYVCNDKEKIDETISSYFIKTNKSEKEWAGSYGILLYEWAKNSNKYSESFIDNIILQKRVGGLSIWESLLGEIHSNIGAHQYAIKRMKSTLVRAKELNEKWGLPFVHKSLSQAFFKEKGYISEECKKHFLLGIQEAKNQGAKWIELNIAYSYCDLLIKENKKEEALELLTPLVNEFPQTTEAPLYKHSLKLIINNKN
ncbi:TOMM system kinase/cyclase fusion protein [Aquimarina sp. TRL1]|uniref:TOMM system kinase/cyclase fusion protein n=1 Tax=Aquimarina sp. (strain TRL1) TaxID=2736252 RepID=UPI00158B7A8C|nr:TOMM system kinase/cyclase fusion protein [Aquimarina sp. TRL1]QKX07054.1 TOMM system kinase/cyclase fusion protein [Aquimarina sp. TRL1]